MIKVVWHRTRYLSTGEQLYLASLELKTKHRYKINVEPEYGKSKYFWTLDVHRLIGQKDYIAKLKESKIVFNAQPRFEKNLKEINPNVYTVLHGVSPEHFKPHSVEKKYDIVFCGAVNNSYGPDRLAMINFLRENCNFENKDDLEYDEYSKFLSSGKLIFNYSRMNEINMRVFEGMAIGCLVTNRVPFLELVGEEGAHYLAYSNEEELLNIVQNTSQKKIDSITKAARQMILNKHTYLHRLKQMVEIIENHETN